MLSVRKDNTRYEEDQNSSQPMKKYIQYAEGQYIINRKISAKWQALNPKSEINSCAKGIKGHSLNEVPRLKFLVIDDYWNIVKNKAGCYKKSIIVN
jgi:hypothetical protein